MNSGARLKELGFDELCLLWRCATQLVGLVFSTVNRPDTVASAAADHPGMRAALDIGWVRMNYFRRNCYWPFHLAVVVVVAVELMMSMVMR